MAPCPLALVVVARPFLRIRSKMEPLLLPVFSSLLLRLCLVSLDPGSGRAGCFLLRPVNTGREDSSFQLVQAGMSVIFSSFL